MTDVTSSQIEAGQAVYGRLTLRAYDALVLGASCSWLWKCPASTLLARYNEHVTSNHLDVGVGSGYFLDRCTFPSASPRVALMDMNENSLAYTARRIERYRPETYRRNVLESMSVDAISFDSIGMNLLLHCVPGDFDYKGCIFDNARKVLNPGGILFGATILSQGVARSWPARQLMTAYNRKGIFSNLDDSEDQLRTALEARFSTVDIDVQGCVALFRARD